jgi:hypothetical protein
MKLPKCKQISKSWKMEKFWNLQSLHIFYGLYILYMRSNPWRLYFVENGSSLKETFMVMCDLVKFISEDTE